MQREVKPKNARSKRALAAREPKLEETVKTAIFARSASTSATVNTALSQLLQLKKPHGIHFSKKSNTGIHPFEDPATLEFWSEKNDAAFVVLGSHSKKRPNDLVFSRMFNHQLLDMLEVGVENVIPMSDFKATKPSNGQTPLFHFAGDLFDTHPMYIQFKSMILDLLHGEVLENVNLVGLEHVISVTTSPLAANAPQLDPAATAPLVPEASTSATDLPQIHFRTYMIRMLKSSAKSPYIALDQCGPSLDFNLRRTQPAADTTWNVATTLTHKRKAHAPKEKLSDNAQRKKKRAKNTDTDAMGDTVGRIHIATQDLTKLQSRKMKGLARAGRGEAASGTAEAIEVDQPSEQ